MNFIGNIIFDKHFLIRLQTYNGRTIGLKPLGPEQSSGLPGSHEGTVRGGPVAADTTASDGENSTSLIRRDITVGQRGYRDQTSSLATYGLSQKFKI